MNAVIACGGTGGHLFPGIAVAEVLRDRGHEVMLLISEKDIDALALSGRTNFRVEKLPTIGLPSAFSPALFGFAAGFMKACPFAGLSIAHLNRRSFWAWVDSLRPRRCWPAEYAESRRLFTNRMLSLERRTD